MVSGPNRVNRSNLRRLRGQGRYFCDNCGRRYHQAKNLRRHVQNECGKQPSYQCSYCPYRATYKSYLEIHMVKHCRGEFTPRVSAANYFDNFNN